MRFAIIIPQGRYKDNHEQIAKFMHDLQLSITHPHALFSCDGKELLYGKSAVLNYALTHINPNDFDIWVTIDDDIRLPRGWMGQLITAFETFPDYVAFGVDWSHTDEGAKYMIEVNNDIKVDSVTIKPLNYQNIAGAFLAVRSKVAQKVGINKGHLNLRYDFSEDGWRCAQYRRYGKLGYLVLQGEKPELLHYNDTQAYLAEKDECIKKLRGKK